MPVVNLGKFRAHGQQYSQLQINRTLSGNLAEQVYIGVFSTIGGNHNLVLSVHDIVADEIVQYRIFTNSSVPQATWNELTPIGKNKILDYNILYRVDGDAITVRMDRALKIQGKKEYKVKVANLGSDLENYSNVPEIGRLPEKPVHPEHHDHPSSKPTFDEFVRLSRRLDHHVHSPAPHSGHEIIVRKNKPNGYAGLDSEGKLLMNLVPEDLIRPGKFTIRIGGQETVFDGKQDVLLDFTNNTITVQGLTSDITSNLNNINAADDDDISSLFDGDPSTPELNPNDPGIYVDNSNGSVEPGEGDPDPEPEVQPNQGGEPYAHEPQQATDDDIGDLFG